MLEDPEAQTALASASSRAFLVARANARAVAPAVHAHGCQSVADARNDQDCPHTSGGEQEAILRHQECRSRLGPARRHAGRSQRAGRGGLPPLLLSRSCSVWAQVRAHEEFADPLFEAMSGGRRPTPTCVWRSHVARPFIYLQTSPHRSFQEAAAPAAGTRQRGELRTSSTPPATSEMLPPVRFTRLRPRVDYSQDTSSGPSSEADFGAA